MTDSPISLRLPFSVITVSAGIVLAAPSAISQSDIGEPIQLLPIEDNEPAVALEPVDPAVTEGIDAPGVATDSQVFSEEPLPDVQATGADDIEIGTLPEVDAEATDNLNIETGGFGPSLWRGTPRELVETLLPRLPNEAPSLAMGDLSRRLLLTAATPPAGEGSMDFTQLRADALVALGELDEAAKLLRTAPAREVDPKLLRMEIEALLLAGDMNTACAQVRTGLESDAEPFWEKALIFCQIYRGQSEAATLGLSLLEELSDMDDRAFVALARLLTGEDSELAAPIHSLSPLHFAMMREAGQPVTSVQVRNMAPSVLSAVAFVEATPLDLRLRAAERATALGLLAPEGLAELYAAVPFAPEEIENPLTAAEGMDGPWGRALLYQVGTVQRVPIARAEVLQKAWQLAHAEGRFAMTVRVTLSIVQDLSPAPELGWFAKDATRAMIAVAKMDEARVWLDLTYQAAARSADGARAILELWPIMQLADPEQALNKQMLSAWWDYQADLPALERRERASLLFSLLEAMGNEVPDEFWAEIIPGPSRVTATVPATPVWQALGRASANLRVGETVLLSLLVLGNGGPATASEPTLVAVITGLRSVGLETEARALAIEAALAAGF